MTQTQNKPVLTAGHRGWHRLTIVITVVGLATAVLAIWALCLGDMNIAIADVVASLGGTQSDTLINYFVLDQRLPRVLAALTVGVAWGAAGALTQSLTRNVLGSPDIIGFSGGASVGAVVTILVIGATPAVVASGALAGGLVTAALVVGLSWSLKERRSDGSDRLVVIGIAVAAACHAVTTLLVARAPMTSAQDASVWLTGSLSTMTWARLVLAVVVLAGCLVAVVVLRAPLDVLSFGDDLAQGLGVGVARVRASGTLLAVALAAIAVATAGPIGFIALAAPHIARLLTRTRGMSVWASCVVGAFLLLAADVFAQRALAPIQLPVGIVTGVFGGVYLVVLLVVTSRRKKGSRL